MTGARRILIAGMGNVLCGDDGFGVAVANALIGRASPPGVHVIEVGIGGIHLVQALMDGYDALIVVDAVERGAPAGTLFVLEPDVPECAPVQLEGDVQAFADMHLAVPARAMVLARALGVLPRRVLIVGCQGANLELGLGMSAPVCAALERALERIGAIVAELARGCTSTAPADTRLHAPERA